MPQTGLSIAKNADSTTRRTYLPTRNMGVAPAHSNGVVAWFAIPTSNTGQTKPVIGTGSQQTDKQTLLRKPIQPSLKQWQPLRQTAQCRIQSEMEDATA
jgi:hypothetical protein